MTGFVSTIVPASMGTQVQGVGADGLGNYYLADLNIAGIRLYNTSDGSLRTLAGNGAAGFLDGVSGGGVGSVCGVRGEESATTIYLLPFLPIARYSSPP